MRDSISTTTTTTGQPVSLNSRRGIVGRFHKSLQRQRSESAFVSDEAVVAPELKLRSDDDGLMNDKKGQRREKFKRKTSSETTFLSIDELLLAGN